MTKQMKNEIENMIKVFNEKNKRFGRKYVLTFDRYARGKYHITIEYQLFHSLDLEEIIEFVQKNGLIMRLSAKTKEKGSACMDIL